MPTVKVERRGPVAIVTLDRRDEARNAGDLRVASRSAVFGVFCRRWGVPLMDGGTFRLARLVGHSRALDMILTGRPVGADEAVAIGLANRVVEEGKALDAAVALAETIAA